jgi:hypothetical protein
MNTQKGAHHMPLTTRLVDFERFNQMPFTDLSYLKDFNLMEFTDTLIAADIFLFSGPAKLIS